MTDEHAERTDRPGDTQPMPTVGVEQVVPEVLRDIKLACAFRGTRPTVQNNLEDRVVERLKLGLQRYGKPLSTWNGRDMALDAYDELLDAQNYLKGLTMEHPNSPQYRLWYWVVQGLVFDMAEFYA